MKKVGLVFILTLLFFSSWSSSAGAEYLTLQHHVSTNHPWQIGCEFLAEELTRQTKGEISLTIFPHGVLAGQDPNRIMEQVQGGFVDLGLASPIVLASRVEEILALYTPFLFDDVDHFNRFRYQLPHQLEGIWTQFHRHNLQVIGLWPYPFRQQANTQRPIRTPADLKGLRLGIPPGDFFLETAEVLGFQPVAFDAEDIYTAMEMGTIQGGVYDLNTLYGTGVYQTAKYFTLWDFMSEGVLVVMNKDRWDSLTPELQGIITEVTEQAGEIVLAAAKEEELLNMEKMEETGVLFSLLTEEERASFREMVQPIWEKMAQLLGASQFEAMVEAVEDAR
ncbi:MAG: TRAP transporter substrate-binding protein [Limnochordia bacterium]